MPEPTCCDLGVCEDMDDDGSYAGREEPDCGDCNDAGLPGCPGCDPDAPRPASVGPFSDEPPY